MRNALRGLLGLVGVIGVTLSGVGATVSPASQRSPSTEYPTAGTVAPNTYNNMDCNGWSSTYQNAVPAMKMRCADPIQPGGTGNPYGSGNQRFYDNGHYVGHDEPSVKFESSVPGSGNTFTFFQQLSTDPTAPPTTNPTASPSVSYYSELSPAPWFGLPICDPNSFPNGACTPDSDTNTSTGSASDAGSAFMELQFYPPGNGPWVDAPSIDRTQWAVALTIDSFECAGNGATGCGSPNPQCVEPVNFAFLTHDGVPMGPPSPQMVDEHSQFETPDTLLMNPGDTVKVEISDVPDPSGTQGTASDTGGLEARVLDLTSGRSGYIVASAKNGFMNTSNASCMGSPFSFHAEFSTAKKGNLVDWAALEGGVLMEDEIGHFEPCATLANSDAVSSTFSDGAFSDPSVMATCATGFEPSTSTGEGPCNTSGNSLLCTNPTTEGSTYGGAACPMTGGHCELADGFCMPKGNRTVSDLASSADVWSWPVAGCQNAQFQNGDLDFDGSDYIADWPDGSSNHPTSFRYLGPFDQNGNPYPQVQFETDAGGSENNCSSSTTSACAVPPSGASFYPFWSITNTQGLNGITPSASGYCAWNFGNDISGVTTNDFGKDSQYGSSGSFFFGTDISAVLTNPTTTTGCTSLTENQVTGAAPASVYTPVTPFRLFDSRSSSCVQCTLSGAFGPGQHRDIPVLNNPSGNGTIPPQATAVVVNLTGVQGTQDTFLSVSPTGASGLGTTSNLNIEDGDIQANLATVPIGNSGDITVYNSVGSIDAVLDVEGYFAPTTTPPPSGTAGTFHAMAPQRVCDTRGGNGTGCNSGSSNPLGPGQSRAVTVALGGTGGVPNDGTAAAVAFNLTATGATAGTFLTAYPPQSDGSCPAPTTSNVNVPAGTDLPNRVFVPIGTGSGNKGKVCIYNSLGSVNFVIDVNGWFGGGTETPLGALFYPTAPTRVCDTRLTSPANQCQANGTLTAGHTLVLNAALSPNAPTSPVAVVANTTGILGTAGTFLSVYPDGPQPSPLTSDLNPGAGDIIANLTVVGLASGGNIDVFNDLGTIDVAVDVMGWFA